MPRVFHARYQGSELKHRATTAGLTNGTPTPRNPHESPRWVTRSHTGNDARRSLRKTNGLSSSCVPRLLDTLRGPTDALRALRRRHASATPFRRTGQQSRDCATCRTAASPNCARCQTAQVPDCAGARQRQVPNTARCHTALGRQLNVVSQLSPYPVFDSLSSTTRAASASGTLP